MPKSSKLFNILWEALTIIISNWRNFLPIILINLLFSSFLFLLNILSITPAMTELIGILPSLLIVDSKSSNYTTILSTMRKDIRHITTIEAIFLLSSFIINSFITMTTIHLVSMTCSDKKQTLQELFYVIKRTWKGPMLTQLFANIVNITISSSVFIFVMVFIMISKGSIGYIVVVFPLSILAIVLFFYVALISSMSIVVSVVEEGCHGLAAFVRSVELVKGRRKIGMMIMFVTILGFGIIGTTYNFLMIYVSSNIFVRLVIGFGYLALIVMMSIVMHGVNTVFYYECKSYGSVLLDVGGGLGYISLQKEVYASASIP